MANFTGDFPQIMYVTGENEYEPDHPYFSANHDASQLVAPGRKTRVGIYQLVDEAETEVKAIMVRKSEEQASAILPTTSNAAGA
jgi:hypothetical protein